MPSIPPRRLNLLDGMILVAGTAVGIALARLCLLDNSYYSVGPYGQPSLRGWLNSQIRSVTILGTICLVVLSPMVLIIRLRQPRPAYRWMFRQPGAIAAFTTSLIILAKATTLIPAFLFGNRSTLQGLMFNYMWLDICLNAGWVVLAGWSIALLTRQWQPERSIIDRTGRLLGWCWLAMFAATIWLEADEVIKVAQSSFSHELRLKSDHAARDSTAEYMRRDYLAKLSRLDELVSSGDPTQLREIIKEQFRKVESEWQYFESQEEARTGHKSSAAIGFKSSNAPPP